MYREATSLEANITPRARRANHFQHKKSRQLSFATSSFSATPELLKEDEVNEPSARPQYHRSNSDVLQCSLLTPQTSEELVDLKSSLCFQQVCMALRTPECLWFAVSDESPGSDAVYIFDPGNHWVRDAWLYELRDIQQMQANLQLALQNPTRFQCALRQQANAISSGDMHLITTGMAGYHSSKNALYTYCSTAELPNAMPREVFRTYSIDGKCLYSCDN